MKQKSIQPARNIPHAEGILMYNDTAGVIPANTMVRCAFSAVVGGALQGNCLKMDSAVTAATALSGGQVPLFITRHAVPVGKYGVVLPWAILTGQNTAAFTVGNPAYLQNGGGIGPGVGTVDRAVGVCLVSDAAAGVIFMNFQIGGIFP
tara:strand:- start:99 stop:545 length:447 start_codon:yes stop_codon:yes gene_type:complete